MLFNEVDYKHNALVMSSITLISLLQILYDVTNALFNSNRFYTQKDTVTDVNLHLRSKLIYWNPSLPHYFRFCEDIHAFLCV